MILATATLCLALNIYFEARGDLIPGQYAVALVTMNRAQHDPRRVCEVVTRHGQFSWTLTRVKKVGNQFYLRKAGIPREVNAWLLANRIARWVLAGKMADFTQGATFYHTPAVRPAWAQQAGYVRRTIGQHIFYRLA